MNVVDEHEALCEQAIRGTFERVEAWFKAPNFSPVEGTELHQDDSDWLPLPLTQMVGLNLHLAAEQLHQVRVMIEANELSLSAQRVLVRTALISGSIATWILSPDDPVARRARHRMLIEQTTYRHHQALTEQAKLELAAGQEIQPNLAAMVSHTADRLAEIKDLRARDGQRRTWNDTEVITEAALFAFRSQADPHALANEAVLEFRITSGAAHGLAWGLFNSPGMQVDGPADRHGRALMTPVPAYAALANGYMAAFHTSAEAWRLLQTRGR